MFTDMVGFTSLAQGDESLAMGLLQEQRKTLRPFFAKHAGREVKTIGDSFLVEFASALDAVKCAIEIQSTLKELNSSRPDELKIQIRIGVHMGDVLHYGSDVGGDAVNVASRIEPLAPTGGICVSDLVHAAVVNKIQDRFESLGRPELKNVHVPIEVFQVQGFGESVIRTVPRSDLVSKDRIAVLPFVNMSPDPNDEYLADGMTEELIDRLSRVKQLRVIARTSIMSFKKKEKTAPEIAKQLGVGSLVEGSIRKSGNKIRVTVQLIDTGTDEHVWSSSYDNELADILTVQSDIAGKVTEELRIQLLGPEKQALERRGTEVTMAYTAFLQARHMLHEGRLIDKAIELFRESIRLDPAFAQAHVGLAECYLRYGNIGVESLNESIEKARGPIRRALELDGELAEAHAILAQLRFNEDYNQAAEAEANRAIELNPSQAEAYWVLLHIALDKGELDEAVRLAEITFNLDPVRPRNAEVLGKVYYYAGRDTEALDKWERIKETSPTRAYKSMAEFFMSKGELEKAAQALSMSEKLNPANPDQIMLEGILAGLRGDEKRARQVVAKLSAGPSGRVGYVYLAMGDLDSFYDYAERALKGEVLNFSFIDLVCDPLFGNARKDPRFKGVMEKMEQRFWRREVPSL